MITHTHIYNVRVCRHVLTARRFIFRFKRYTQERKQKSLRDILTVVSANATAISYYFYQNKIVTLLRQCWYSIKYIRNYNQ